MRKRTKILDSLYGTLIASHMTPTEDTYKFRGDVGLSWDRYIDNYRILVREYVKRRAKGEESQNNVKIRVMVTQNTASNVSINETAHEARAILQEWNNFVSEVEREEGIEPFPEKTLKLETFYETIARHLSLTICKRTQLTFGGPLLLLIRELMKDLSSNHLREQLIVRTPSQMWAFYGTAM